MNKSHCQTQNSMNKAIFKLKTVWSFEFDNALYSYCFEFHNGFIHTVLSLIMALLILFWVWQCVLLILFWVWQSIINLKTVWISHCQTQNSMNKAIVKLKTVWVKHIVKLRTVWVKHIVKLKTVILFWVWQCVLLILFWVWQCTLFILFWVWQWLYSYCFEFDNGFIHTVWVKHIVKLKTVWVKPLSISKQYV
jgi:hypothetical protein